MSKIVLLFLSTGIYLGICIGIGVYCNITQRKIKSIQYFNASGSLGPIVLSLTMMATVFSAWFILGHQGSAWMNGLKYIPQFAHVQLLGFASIIFLPRMWVVARANGVVTMSEAYGIYYKSEFIRVLVVISGFLFAMPYIALQLRGAGIVFNSLSGGSISIVSGTLIISAAVVLYCLLGGIKAASITATVQGLLIAVAGTLLFVTVIGAVTAKFADTGFFLTFKQGIESQGTGYYTIPPVGQMWSWAYAFTYCLASVGIYFSPPYMMTVSSSESPKMFRFQAFVIMGIVMGIMYYIFTWTIGVGSKSLITSIVNTDALSTTLIYNYMGPVAFILTALGILAAMNSTAAGYLTNSATILTRDVYVRYINKKASGSNQILFSRVMILMIIACSIIFSLSVLDVLTQLGSLSAAFGAQLIPAMVGITYLPKLKGKAVNAGIITGSIGVLLFFFVWNNLYGIHCGGWGLAINLITVVLVQLFSKNAPEPDVAFSHGYWDNRFAVIK